MFNLKFFTFALITTFYQGVFAQNIENINLNSGETPMQISLQKELFDILISDSNEVQEEYKINKTFYTNSSLKKYKEIFSLICKNDPLEKCPDLFFTTRDISGIASMYPNAVLAINESIMSRINTNEATFVLAHEYAHYKFQHSKQRVKIIAKTVVDNALMIREPEQALASAGFMSQVAEAHHKYEDEADIYAFNYITIQQIKIHCERMFNKIVGESTVSTEKHKPISGRCENYLN